MKKTFLFFSFSLIFVFTVFSYFNVDINKASNDSFSSPSAKLSFLNSGDMSNNVSAVEIIDAFDSDVISSYGSSTSCSSGCTVSCSTYCSTNCSRSCSNKCK
jgi:hypothetical protein